MSLDITQFIGGAGVAVFRGQTFFAKIGNGIQVDPSPSLFSTGSDVYNDQNPRLADRPIKVSLIPTGVYADHVGILLPYANARVNDLIHKMIKGVTFNATTEVWSYTGHGFVDGDAVRVATTGTLPAGLSATTTYYVGAVDADSGKLYSTRADAITDDGSTGLVSITNTGSGTHSLVQSEPLVLHTLAGQKLTLHNAAITKMPEVTCAPTETLWGGVEWMAFPLNGTNWSDANSLYTLADVAFSNSDYDDADVITAEYSAAWGSSSPWSALIPKDAIRVAWNEQFDPVTSASHGLVSMRLRQIRPAIRMTPMNISETDLLTKQALQGSGVTRGSRLATGDTFNIIGPSNSPYFRFYNARLVQHPFQLRAGQERSTDWTWEATRQITAGVAGAWFYAGTTTPS